eukprot:TRINITY_DN1435_c0_g6_i1.p1 TRINITY_DN1435_c0_g6~~TRINITY_DN1435_c0_g6_i1.p1  ORF type:complete len:118 (+),score=22.29 TRINITY_DN1435_c0_g6_i1:165-518(+)
MRFNITALLCILILSIVAEAKYKQKLLALYKEATKGLTKEEKKMFFKKLFGGISRGISKVAGGISKFAKGAVKVVKKGAAIAGQLAPLISKFHPGAGMIAEKVGMLAGGDTMAAAAA